MCCKLSRFPAKASHGLRAKHSQPASQLPFLTREPSAKKTTPHAFAGFCFSSLRCCLYCRSPLQWVSALLWHPWFFDSSHLKLSCVRLFYLQIRTIFVAPKFCLEIFGYDPSQTNMYQPGNQAKISLEIFGTPFLLEEKNDAKARRLLWPLLTFPFTLLGFWIHRSKTWCNSDWGTHVGSIKPTTKKTQDIISTDRRVHGVYVYIHIYIYYILLLSLLILLF